MWSLIISQGIHNLVAKIITKRYQKKGISKLSIHIFFIVLNISRDLEKFILFCSENVVYQTTGEMETVLKAES